MYKFRMLDMLFGAVLVLALAGCSKDNCANCPDTATPLASGTGVCVLTNNGIWQSIWIHGHGPAQPTLDSARVGDSLCNGDWIVSVNPSVGMSVNFYEDGTSTTRMYDPGDTAVISIWGEGRSSTCRVKLLNESESIILFVSPASYLSDTISRNQSDTVIWHQVEHADYYAVLVEWTFIAGSWKYGYNYTSDTTFVLDGALIPDSADMCYVTVTPFNGPDPRTEKSNWTGDLLDGAVFSSGRISNTEIVVNPIPLVPRGVPSQAAQQRSALRADEIVAKVYEKFSQGALR